MIEFNGAISEEVRQKEIKNQAKRIQIRFIIGTIVSAVVLAFVLAVKYLFSETKPTFMELFSGSITPFFLLVFVVFAVMLIVSFVKPQYNKDLDKTSPYSVKLDNDKIIYEPSEGFGKREFNYSNLKKIIDEGSFYVLVSKENNIRLVCQKDLLVQGSLKEFDDYFSKIIDRKVEVISNEVEEHKEEKLEAKQEEVVVDNKKEADGVAGENKDATSAEAKTFKNEKFKKSKTRNEKSFKFALIGIILGVASVALTPFVVKYGINFAINGISNLFNTLFYGGFVIEFFTFIFACLITLLATIFLFATCILLMPAIALLSLIFPIYQLVAVNHRWFSWVALAVGILSVIGCLALAVVTIQAL